MPPPTIAGTPQKTRMPNFLLTFIQVSQLFDSVPSKYHFIKLFPKFKTLSFGLFFSNKCKLSKEKNQRSMIMAIPIPPPIHMLMRPVW